MPLPNDFIVVVVEAQTNVVATVGGGGVAAIRPGPGIDVDQETGIVTVSTVSGLDYQEIDLGGTPGATQQDLGGYLETVFVTSLSANGTVQPPTSAVVGARFAVDVTYNTHTYTHPAASGLTYVWANGPGAPAASSTNDLWLYWIRAVQFTVNGSGEGVIIPSLIKAWQITGFA